MWESILTRIKNLFTYEVDVPVDEKVIREDHKELADIQHNQNQALEPKTKVIYQYPKDQKTNEFKPKQSVDKNRTETRNKRTQKQHTPNQQLKQSERQFKAKSRVEEELLFLKNHSKQRSEPTAKRNNQVQKTQPFAHYQHTPSFIEKETNRQPFKLTPVPSPIYGFHKRDPYETETKTPAFIRKQQRHPVEEQREDTQTDVTLQPEEKSNIKKKRNPIQSGDYEQNVFQSILSEHELEPNIERDIEEVIKVEQQGQSDMSNKHSTRRTSRDESKQVNSDTEIPYNVMRNREEIFKSYQEDQQEQEETVPTVNNEEENEPLQKLEQEAQMIEETEESEASIPFHLLDDPELEDNDDAAWIVQQQELLEQTLEHFNVAAKVVNATEGPSVTRFEVQPELGVKVSKIKNLSDDLKLNMSAKDIRIEAPIPGKNTIGIEIPNRHPQMVGLQEIFDSEAFEKSTSPLTIGLGLNIEGEPVVTNIHKMPHGLIAGATGSGKSVCINTILISLLYKSSHKDVRLMLIDPKMVELAAYNGIPHLVSPVITDVKAATAALKWAVQEMEDRYQKFVHEGVRDITKYNEKMTKQNRVHEKMSYLVIVIDELADLMMISPQDVEDSIARIAQKARACGMHLLLATQRPSVDVITGLIKANIPTRIAFSVSSQIDSRTILDASGAEKLLGKGDMLFVENGSGKSTRIQGAFVSDEEIERVTNHVRTIAEPNYLFEQEELLAKITTDEEEDELLPAAIDFVLEANQASTSLLQRHFRIGYNRAARLIDTLEHRGIINQQNGSKPREVLITKSQLNEMLQ